VIGVLSGDDSIMTVPLAVGYHAGIGGYLASVGGFLPVDPPWPVWGAVAVVATVCAAVAGRSGRGEGRRGRLYEVSLFVAAATLLAVDVVLLVAASRRRIPYDFGTGLSVGGISIGGLGGVEVAFASVFLVGLASTGLYLLDVGWELVRPAVDDEAVPTAQWTVRETTDQVRRYNRITELRAVPGQVVRLAVLLLAGAAASVTLGQTAVVGVLVSAVVVYGGKLVFVWCGRPEPPDRVRERYEVYPEGLRVERAGDVRWYRWTRIDGVTVDDGIARLHTSAWLPDREFHVDGGADLPAAIDPTPRATDA
jgi:hypothetical protein